MGCNTSQEMKTKDGATAAANAEEGGDSAPLENGVASDEQKGGGGEGAAEGGGGICSATTTNNAQTKSANSHTNHSKSNSIISNGEATKQHSKDAVESALALAKQNGMPGEGSGGDGGERQCGKAEISELNDMELGEDEAKAATRIQAVFRGHQVRNTMKKCETKTTNTSSSSGSSNTAAATNKNGDNNGAASAAEAEPTKAELEAEFDPNDKELCDAALKIQATFRGHLSRKLVNKEVPEDEDIQEITKKVAEELDIDLTDPELNKAATKIQASFRGHKIRKDVTTGAE